MTICYYRGENITKSIVKRKIKKWVNNLNDGELSRFCDFINDMDNEVSFMVGPYNHRIKVRDDLSSFFGG